MKIIAPLSSPAELEMLLHYGADEIYCGINTPEWEEHFRGRWWLNRRTPNGANLLSLGKLADITATAHAQGVPINVTLNASFYTGESIGYVVRLAHALHERAHVDSVIVSDLNLLMELAESAFPGRIHLSSLGSCFNSRTVEFYKSLGVHRIILPRQLRMGEIRTILERCASIMEFEVFAVNDGCCFEEGFCQTTHALEGPFCLTEWEAEILPQGRTGATLPDSAEALEGLREYLWYQNNCGSSFQEDGLPNGPCSLCEFAHFRDWGVTSVKIIGREGSFYRKMRSLQLVKAVMDEVRAGAAPERIEELSRSLRNTPSYCDKGYMCYFRDVP